MKEKHLYLILLFYAFFVNAQIDKDAIIGLPIVTNNAQMNGILTPNEGSILYNSAEKKFTILMVITGLLPQVEAQIFMKQMAY